MGIHAHLGDGGGAHGPQLTADVHRVAGLDGHVLGQVAVPGLQAAAVVHHHGGAHHGVSVDLLHGARADGQHLHALGGGDVQPAVGAPVPHGGVQGQGLHAVVPEDSPLYRPGKDLGDGLAALLGVRLRSGVLHWLRVVRLDGGRGVRLGLGAEVNGGGVLIRPGDGNRGPADALVGDGDGGAAPRRLGGMGALYNGLEQIIARNSYGGDTQEQDYVKALSHGEVAQFSPKALVFQKTTSEAYFGQPRGWLYMESKNFPAPCKKDRNGLQWKKNRRNCL